MKRRYRISPRADRDLADIWDYIARSSPTAANNVEEKLSAAMESLEEFPNKGHERQDVPRRGLRVWSVYSYLIVYRVEAKHVVIVRVVHGARDLSKLF